MTLDELKADIPFFANFLELDKTAGNQKHSVKALIKHFTHDHWERVTKSIDMILKAGVTGTRSMDVGSWLPAIGYYLFKNLDMKANCCSVDVFPWKRTYGQHWQLDICEEEIPEAPYDLVISQEMLEHLPCNVFAVVDKLCNAVVPRGLLCISVPIGRQGAKLDKSAILKNYPTRFHHHHLREFKEGELKAMIPANFTPLDLQYVSTPAYPRMEINVFRKIQ